MAKKLSVLKPQRLRNLVFFFHGLITVLRIQFLILIKTCSEKNLSMVQNLN